MTQTDYYRLKNEMGILGFQIYAHAWGIDQTFLVENYKPKSKSIGNSQVLDCNYTKREAIEIIIRGMGDQVAGRLLIELSG